MKSRIFIIVTLGLALAIYLVMTIGVGTIVTAALTVGRSGFAILCLYALGLFVILGAACGVLIPHFSLMKALPIFTWSRMVRDAATEVLPFSQVGGLVMGARAAVLWGVPQPVVFAATTIDITTELLAQAGYVALGAWILTTGVTRTALSHSLASVLVIDFIFAGVMGMFFVGLLRYRQRIAAMIMRRLLPSTGTGTGTGTGAEVGAARILAALDAMYGSRMRVVVSVALHFSGWIASAVGVWIAFGLMGSRVELTSVIAVESLVCAARSAAFFVPNALGVQEGAYAILSPWLGVGAEIGLAVSLLKRARDIVVGVPILLVWQLLEGGRALRRARSE